MRYLEKDNEFDGEVVHKTGQPDKEVTVEVMKMKVPKLSDYAKNYFKEVKYDLREVYNFCLPFKFDNDKIDAEIKSL